MLFDPTKVEDIEPGFTPMPAGWYRVMVDGLEIKPTQAGGTRASVRATVLEGQYAKRKLFAGFNIINNSAEAQRIGQSEFKRFLKAVGITTAVDLSELHPKIVNKSLFFKVGLTKNYKTGEPDNEVKDYSDTPKAAERKSSGVTLTTSKPSGGIDEKDLPF